MRGKCSPKDAIGWRHLRETLAIDIALTQEAHPPDGSAAAFVRRHHKPAKKDLGTAVVSFDHELIPETSFEASTLGRATGAIFPALKNLIVVSVHSLPAIGNNEDYPSAVSNIIENTLAMLPNDPDRPVLIGGDFNASMEYDWKDFTPPFAYLESIKYKNLLCTTEADCVIVSGVCLNKHQKTYRFRGQQRCVDYLFGNAPLMRYFKHAAVDESPEAWIISDHRAVVAEFDFTG
jgi:endonuclease/exonuclease/phosphatase (EEP) superfamily protein YafD